MTIRREFWCGDFFFTKYNSMKVPYGQTLQKYWATTVHRMRTALRLIPNAMVKGDHRILATGKWSLKSFLNKKVTHFRSCYKREFQSTNASTWHHNPKSFFLFLKKEGITLEAYDLLQPHLEWVFPRFHPVCQTGIANDKHRHFLLISSKTFLSQSFSPGFASVWPTLPKYPRLLDDEVWGDEGSSVTLLLDGPEVWLEAEIKRFHSKYASMGDQKPPHLSECKSDLKQKYTRILTPFHYLARFFRPFHMVWFI